MATEILIVNLEPGFYPRSSPKRIISYKGNSISLTDDEYNSVVNSLPSYWHTSKDKMIRFIVFEEVGGNKKYYCEREKEVFNYTHRDYEKKVYQFNPQSDAEGEALYLLFVEKYTRIKLSRADDIYEKILSEVRDLSYIKFSLLNSRDIMLKNSDYLMMMDYPLDEETKQLWAIYRQQLRDITEQEAWINNDLMNIEMPISPDPLSQLSVLEGNFSEIFTVPVGLMEDAISFVREKIDQNDLESILKQISSITIKYEILKSLSRLKLPFLESDYNISEKAIVVGDLYDQLLEEINGGYDELSAKEDVKTELDFSIERIDAVIKNINNNLKNYDIGFTINDILNAIMEKNKKSEFDLEVQDIIEDL
jgi:hypothetical protein